ncbi:hypothetical protein D3C84_1315830 [compost metagenome]
MTHHGLNKVLGGLKRFAGRLGLSPPQAKAGGEHREKPIGMNEFGADIGQGDQGKGQVIIRG